MVDYMNNYVTLSVILCALHLPHAEENVTFESKLSDVVFIVLSQSNPYHAGRARKMQAHFAEQLSDYEMQDMPELHLTHKKWPIIGTWTVFPLINSWSDDFPTKKWMFICEEETRINLKKIEQVIKRFDPEKDWFLGHALKDREATIIHHFKNPNELTFPDFAAGLFLSTPLIKKLANRWPDEGFKGDFAIDPKHELAVYIKMDKVTLTDIPELCSEEERPDCATTFPTKFPKCGRPISENDLFVAVKTCEKFHEERVSVVKKTWAKETSNIEFYSETEDPSIPTIDLGIPNTERGHCGKTMALMKRAVTEPHISSKKWLLVADDDTIINIDRLRKLLACYSPNSNVALGERYGYMVSKGYGYDYITGGGGMVFSLPMVKKLVEECSCASNDAPDDMIIGMCLNRMKIPITHIPYFHQARPDDYSSGYLNRQIPVSFHKHWMVDPYKVYKQLKQYDKEEEKESQTIYADKHEEL